MRKTALAICVSLSLSGCGLEVPKMAEFWDQDYPGDKEHDVPPITSTGQMEYEIRKRIFCDLKYAVREAQKIPFAKEDPLYNKNDPKHNKQYIPEKIIPENWEAHVSISLEVDESTAFNPGVSLNTPLHNATTNFAYENLTPTSNVVANAATYPFLSTAQSYAFGLGGNISASATRIDKFDPYYLVSQLDQKIPENGICYSNTDDNYRYAINDVFVKHSVDPSRSSLLLSSHLGLTEWLTDAIIGNKYTGSLDEPPALEKKDIQKMKDNLKQQRDKFHAVGYSDSEISQIVATQAGAAGGGGGSGTKPDTLTIEIKFIVVTSGNVTPTWKLVRVSANTGAIPLLATGRTRTHDLIITLGPPTQGTANTHLASQIGAAIRGPSNFLPTTP